MSKKQSTNILSAIGYISSLLLLFGVILSFVYGSYNMGFGLLGVMVILLVCVVSFNEMGSNDAPHVPPRGEAVEKPVEPRPASSSRNTMSKDLCAQSQQFVSRAYFESVSACVTSLQMFVERLSHDKGFREKAIFVRGLNIEFTDGDFGKLDYKSFGGKLHILVMIDLVRNLEGAGHPLNLMATEGLGILLYVLRNYGIEQRGYEYVNLLYKENSLAMTLEGLLRQMMQLPEPDSQFILSDLLQAYDTELQRQYHVLMYRFMSLAAKCDGHVTMQESKWLKEIMNLPEQRVLHPFTSEKEELSPRNSLEELIGLAAVKHEVTTLANLTTIQQKRADSGLKQVRPCYHCVFSGNPGTGKTTVARILAGIYRELGVLKQGHLVETDRSGLVAEYVGQTAVKTNAIIDKALDGVLFIDEAYTLVQGGENDFGREAIATLLKRMEDDRNRLVVILAGYTAEMNVFLESNPGLQSRFNKHIHFPDYDAGELMQIFESNMAKYDYVISAEARQQLERVFAHAVSTRNKNFGNGRYVRNLFDKAIELQASRLALQPHISVDELKQLIADDIPPIE